MRKILFFLSVFLFFSCSNDNDTITNEEINFNIESYNHIYANYSSNVNPIGDKVKIKYDGQGRIIKRIGDLLYFASGSGSSPTISDSLYTDLEYFENKVKLTKKISYLDYSIRQNEAIIMFDLENGMTKKTIKYQSDTGEIVFDTINFSYSGNKLLNYIKTSKIEDSNNVFRFFEESNLYYNNQNLDSIVTIKSSTFNNEPKIFSKRETKIFENYDLSFNPFKKLNIFEETFYRSLSTNNYRKYTETSREFYYVNDDYNTQPLMRPLSIDKVVNWEFNYDAINNWIYN